MCWVNYWVIQLSHKEGNESVIVQPNVYPVRDASPLCKVVRVDRSGRSFNWKSRTRRTTNQCKPRRAPRTLVGKERPCRTCITNPHRNLGWRNIFQSGQNLSTAAVKRHTLRDDQWPQQEHEPQVGSRLSRQRNRARRRAK